MSACEGQEAILSKFKLYAMSGSAGWICTIAIAFAPRPHRARRHALAWCGPAVNWTAGGSGVGASRSDVAGAALGVCRARRQDSR